MPVPTANLHVDSDLVLRAQRGELAAFSHLMEEHQSRLLAQALVFCGDPHQARDLVQETMAAAWKSIARFDGSCRFFTWLYVILLRQHRRSLGWFSRRLPLATLEQQALAERVKSADESPRDSSDDFEATLLRAMVAALPSKHREVVRLRFYADSSEAEIAAALGISAGTVKSRLHHALEKLQQMKEKVNRLRDFQH